MIKQAEHNVLESAIQLTEERNKRSLATALITTLAKFIHFDAMLVLRIPRTTDNNCLHVMASEPTDAFQHKLELLPLEYGELCVLRDEYTIRCIETGKPVFVEIGDSVRTIFPIFVDNSVVGLIDLYGYLRTDESENIVCGFIGLYSNFLALINDSEHDTLTGLLNRKTFDHHLSELLSSLAPGHLTKANDRDQRRNIDPNLCHWLGILDIDNFKNINDNFGHVYGDEVLLLFSDLMKKTFRTSDLLFRYGGEEFVAVLLPCTEADAILAFERFRKKLEQYEFPQIGQVTVSIGMVRIDTDTHSSSILSSADQALYYAKEHGRNRVCYFDSLVKQGELQVRDINSDIELF